MKTFKCNNIATFTGTDGYPKCITQYSVPHATANSRVTRVFERGRFKGGPPACVRVFCANRTNSRTAMFITGLFWIEFANRRCTPNGMAHAHAPRGPRQHLRRRSERRQIMPYCATLTVPLNSECAHEVCVCVMHCCCRCRCCRCRCCRCSADAHRHPCRKGRGAQLTN